MREGDFDGRLKELGISIPVTNPAANYVNAVRTGNLLFLSGKGPCPENGGTPEGKLGREFSVDDGYRFARAAGLSLLSSIIMELGTLNVVARIVEVQGFVNATEDFKDHALVLDGCSDLLVDIFGSSGNHARSVFGATSLRGQLPVIVKGVVELLQS